MTRARQITLTEPRQKALKLTLRRFRNRLAHHDSILSQPVKERHEQMIEIVSFLDAGASDSVSKSSDVTRLLGEPPLAD